MEQTADPQQEQTQLKGTGVSVYKEGSLLVKSSVLGSRHLCSLVLCGRTLTVSRNDQGKARLYNLGGATVLRQDGQHRLLVQLANKEKISLFAANEMELEEWVETLTDCIEWKIQRFYDIGPELGHGAFATVRKGKHRITGDIVAIKIINKGACTEENMMYLQREIDIARALRHKNIVRTNYVFESNDRLYIVLEYMSGGTLERFVRRNGILGEDGAHEVIRDVLNGIAYLHSEGIVHRDLKPENIMCSGKKAPMTAKLMDFGLSRYIEGDKQLADRKDSGNGLGPGGLMTTPVGTPGFVAPEVLRSLPYGKEVDMFACGIILYWSLCGQGPFDHEEPDQTTQLAQRGEFSFSGEEWDKISTSAKDLISRMLDQSPYARISAVDALNHPWMKKNGQARVLRKKTVKAKEEDDLDFVDPETFGGGNSGRGESSSPLKSPKSVAS